MDKMRFICSLCGDIEKSEVQIYNLELRRQDFAMSPIVPVCLICGAELDIANPVVDAEIIILNGTCGSGKSTIAEVLMKRFGYGVIDGDCVLQAARHRLQKKVIHNSVEFIEEVEREILFLSAFTDKIILSHIIIPVDIDDYIRMFVKLGVRFRHVLLKPDIDTAVSRCNTRTCHENITPEFWVRFFDKELMYTKEDDVHIIDNTNLTIDEAIIEIMKTHITYNNK